MIMQSILSFFLSLLAVFLPLIILIFLRGPLKVVAYSFSPLLQLIFAVLSYKSYPVFYNKYSIWEWTLFYSTIISASLVLFSILITSVISGIRNILYQSTSNTKAERLRLLLYLFYFITMPHLVFSLIYAFWGLVSKADNITIFRINLF